MLRLGETGEAQLLVVLVLGSLVVDELIDGLHASSQAALAFLVGLLLGGGRSTPQGPHIYFIYLI